MVLLCTHPRGRWLPSRVVWLKFFFSLVIHHHLFLSGSIFHPKLYPPHTKRLSDLPVLLLFVLEAEKVHIAHPVGETVMDTAVRKMKVHQENIDHISLVWVGVLLGISWDFYLVVECGKFLLKFCHDHVPIYLALNAHLFSVPVLFPSVLVTMLLAPRLCGFGRKISRESNIKNDKNAFFLELGILCHFTMQDPDTKFPVSISNYCTGTCE